MKTLFAAAMAVSLLTGSLAVQADDRDDRERGRQHHDRDHGRDHGRKDFRGHDRHDDDDDDRGRHDRYDHRRYGRRHDNWDRRDAYRWGYVQGRVDQRRFDRGRYIAPRGYHVRHWRRGDCLPSAYYSSRYIVRDYHVYHLDAPPRGYHWVRVNDDALLAAITSGVVASVVDGLFY